MRNPLRALCGIADDPDPAPAAPRLVLQRLEHDDHATLGELMRDGRRLCYTLENRPPRVPGVKEPEESRIPAGIWPLGLRGKGGFYNRHRKRWRWHEEMVEILLPGWQWVLVHTGNYHTDTAGCVLVGERYGDSDRGLAVWASRAAYVRVYPELLALARQGGVLDVRDEVTA